MTPPTQRTRACAGSCRFHLVHDGQAIDGASSYDVAVYLRDEYQPDATIVPVTHDEDGKELA